LKKSIKGCNFGEAENKILRTQKVLAIFDKETQTRLLRDDVALDKVVTYCQSIERAESNRRTLFSTKDVDKVVHGVGFKSKWRAKNMEKKIINKLKEESEINHFFKIRSDLTVEDELVYFENRVIIPTTLRYSILKQLHGSHQGVSKTKELA